MATDYDAPRKQEDGSDSLDALKRSIPQKSSLGPESDDPDNSQFTIAEGPDLSDVEMDVVVIPPQQDEFTCVECFLVKHRTQLDHIGPEGPICRECASGEAD